MKKIIELLLYQKKKSVSKSYDNLNCNKKFQKNVTGQRSNLKLGKTLSDILILFTKCLS